MLQSGPKSNLEFRKLIEAACEEEETHKGRDLSSRLPRLTQSHISTKMLNVTIQILQTNPPQALHLHTSRARTKSTPPGMLSAVNKRARRFERVACMRCVSHPGMRSPKNHVIVTRARIKGHACEVRGYTPFEGCASKAYNHAGSGFHHSFHIQCFLHGGFLGGSKFVPHMNSASWVLICAQLEGHRPDGSLMRCR